MLLATLSYAAGGVLARRSSQGLGPTDQSLLQLVFATLYGWFSVLAIDRHLVFPAMPITWLAVAWLGLLGSFAAYLLFFALLNEVGPTRTTLVTYVLPLMGVLMGAIFLAERLSWNALLGGVLILSGVMIVNRWK
jgi:drug/metabolite transporter (DMT)-like permease